MRATFYVNSGFVNSADVPGAYYMSWSQISQLAAEATRSAVTASRTGASRRR